MSTTPVELGDQLEPAACGGADLGCQLADPALDELERQVSKRIAPVEGPPLRAATIRL